MSRALAEDDASLPLTVFQCVVALRELNAGCLVKPVSDTVDAVYVVLKRTTFQKELTARVVGNAIVTSGSEEVEIIIRSVVEIMRKVSLKIKQAQEGFSVAVGRAGKLTEDRIKTIRKVTKRLQIRHFDNRNRNMNTCLADLSLCTKQLLVEVAVRDTFVKKPSEDTTDLWERLVTYTSSEELLQQCPYKTCPVCCGWEDFKADGDFAVNNNCSHLLCLNCAERVFNVNDKEVG